MEVLFQVTIDNLKQIILKKDEAIPNFLMEINKYKHINLQTLQSQVQDSVENLETHKETQGQANQEPRETSAPGFAAPDPCPEAPPQEFLSIPVCQPFEDKVIDECIANFRCEGNCISEAYSQT